MGENKLYSDRMTNGSTATKRELNLKEYSKESDKQKLKKLKDKLYEKKTNLKEEHRKVAKETVNTYVKKGDFRTAAEVAKTHLPDHVRHVHVAEAKASLAHGAIEYAADMLRSNKIAAEDIASDVVKKFKELQRPWNRSLKDIFLRAPSNLNAILAGEKAPKPTVQLTDLKNLSEGFSEILGGDTAPLISEIKELERKIALLKELGRKSTKENAK